MNIGDLIEKLSQLDRSLPVYATADLGNGEAIMDIGVVRLREDGSEAGGEATPVPWVEIGVYPNW